MLAYSGFYHRWGAPPDKHIIEVDGHPLTLWERRPEQPRAAILLLHGRTWSSIPDFDLQVAGERLSFMENLADAGLAVYALDLRGYGATPRNANGWATPRQASEDVAATLQWIQHNAGFHKPPFLLGWSQGASVAWLSEQRFPDRAAALILYGFSLDPSNPRPNPKPGPLPARLPNREAAAREDFITEGTINPLAIETFVTKALETDPIYCDWQDRDDFNHLDPTRPHLPTLLVHGALDPYVKLEAHAWIFNRLAHPYRQWSVIPHGDHMTHLEHCRYHFIQVIMSFLEELLVTRVD